MSGPATGLRAVLLRVLGGGGLLAALF